jgi:hypothetical protein
MTQLILFNVFNGLIVGAFYALMALGLSLILNLSGVINSPTAGSSRSAHILAIRWCRPSASGARSS